MKYLMIVLACLMVAGCVTKGPRFNPNARLKAKQTCCVEKNCCSDSEGKRKASNKRVEKKIGHGDALGKRIADAKKRIQTAVDEGKMTPEEGKEMMDALNKRVKEGRKNRGK